jgi:hypothetical protein
MSNIFGRAAKAAKNSWYLVPNSEQKLTKKQLSNTTAVVFQSKFDDSKLVARVTVNKEYVDFTVDRMCPLEEGDFIDPKSIRVYDLTDGETTITRLWGKAR